MTYVCPSVISLRILIILGFDSIDYCDNSLISCVIGDHVGRSVFDTCRNTVHNLPTCNMFVGKTVDF